MHACMSRFPLSRLPSASELRLHCTFAALPAQLSALLTRGVQDPAKRHALPACLLLAVPGLFGGLTVIQLVCSGRGGVERWAKVGARLLIVLPAIHVDLV
jgi:hypothetical protein